MSVEFALRYDGRDATAHMLDARLFGRSLIGLDRVINDGVVILAEGRKPRRGERLDFSVKAGSPHPACVELRAIIEPLGGVLPLFYEELVKLGPKFVFHLFSYLLTTLGGRPKQAEPHFAALMDFAKQLDRTADLRDERMHDTLRQVVETLKPSARDLVAPIGPSCDTLTLQGPGRGDTTEVDVPMANAVRAKEKLEVGDMERMVVRVDGVEIHSRHLTIEHPERPGRYMKADIRDPVFDQQPEIFIEAIGRSLEVDVKPSRKANGDLAALHIMSAIGRAFDVAA